MDGKKSPQSELFQSFSTAYPYPVSNPILDGETIHRDQTCVFVRFKSLGPLGLLIELAVRLYFANGI